MIDETYSPGGRNHTDDDGPMVMIVDENDEAYFGVTVLYCGVMIHSTLNKSSLVE